MRSTRDRGHYQARGLQMDPAKALLSGRPQPSRMRAAAMTFRFDRAKLLLAARNAATHTAGPLRTPLVLGATERSHVDPAALRGQPAPQTPKSGATTNRAIIPTE